MHRVSRRTFLQAASASVAGAALWNAPRLMANPLGLPIGLQLYSVRDLLPKDYEGTLRQLAALGYRDVEAAGFFDRSAREVKRAMDAAGLRCVSAHYDLEDLVAKLDETIQFGKYLGLKYIICAWPIVDVPSHPKPEKLQGHIEAMTLDDWKWNAEQLNRVGERMRSAGLRFGYHNHTAEFRPENGVVVYDELLRATDPDKVTMEMDCGWVVVGGGNPADYLTRYPTRISMLHVKDFKLSDATANANATESDPPPPAELGRGSIDYRRIFEAAKKAAIEHAFVEQESFDLPALEALKIDADFMRKLKV